MGQKILRRQNQRRPKTTKKEETIEERPRMRPMGKVRIERPSIWRGGEIRIGFILLICHSLFVLT